MAIIFIFLKNERKHRRKTAELLNILPQSWKLSLGLLQFLKVFSTINILSIEVKKGISIPYPLLHNTIVCKKEMFNSPKAAPTAFIPTVATPS